MTNDSRPVELLVGANVARYRRSRQLDLQGLSDRLGQLGRPMPPSSLSKLETGKRRALTLDDVMALSVALNVSPVWLLMGWEAETSTQILPELAPVPDGWLRAWWAGTAPLPVASDDIDGPADGQRGPVGQVRRFREVAPPRVRAELDAEAHDLLREVRQLHGWAHSALDDPDSIDDPAKVAAGLRDVARRIKDYANLLAEKIDGDLDGGTR